MIEKVGQFWVVLVVALLCITTVCIVGLCMGHDGAMISTFFSLVGALAGGGGVYGGLRLVQKRTRSQ